MIYVGAHDNGNVSRVTSVAAFSVGAYLNYIVIAYYGPVLRPSIQDQVRDPHASSGSMGKVTCGSTERVTH